jgi:pyruvate kinase
LVPAIQKKIIGLCNTQGVPVITATQMLESMTTNSRPTRAEANDVANAIWDGTDAVMLSGETASGKYPVEAVEMMSSIVEEAEKMPKERPLLRHMDLHSITSSLQIAASLIAEKTNAKWVMSVTQSGNSCLKMSRFRSTKRILGVTNSIQVMRKMALYWGITPFYFQEKENDIVSIQDQMIEILKERRLVENGDKIVITHGDGNYFKQGTSNSLRVDTVKDVPREKASNKFDEAEIDKDGRIILDTSLCASCQMCISVCPHNIYKISADEDKTTLIDKAKAPNCSFDMECVEKCPTGALEIISTKL